MQNKILLGVNIDHVATLRQARGTEYPDPVQAGILAEQAGADSITVHLREDRRHIQERDVILLKEKLQVPLNLEMAVTEEMLRFAEKVKPQHCCLVPERREELTTEGGLDVANQFERVKAFCERLAKLNIEVSLFIDADPKQLEAAVKCQVPAIEIHTGHYADAKDITNQNSELQRIKAAAKWAKEQSLIVNAGHGLHYQNVQPIAAIPQLTVLNIGHSIVAHSVFTGIKEAVGEMKRLMLQVRKN